MAIGLRSSAEARNTGTTNHLVTTPSGAAIGDVLYGIWYAVGSAVWTAPSGWTPLINVDSATYGSILICRLVLSGAPASDYTATTAANESTWGLLTAWTGVDTTTPEDVATDSDQNALGTYTTPSIVTATAGAVLLCYWAQGANLAITVDGATTPIDAGALGPSYGASYEVIASPGATGTRTATGMNNNNTTASVAIRPYVAPPAGGVANSSMLMGIGI